jgi:glucokinase
VISSARTGDKESVTALAETGWWLGLGLASLSPLFAPDAIVVGGGMAAAGELLLEPTRASYQKHAAPDHRQRVRITGSSFHGWEGMVGAACLILSPLP